jgi:uncharacterized membrane protein YheB (UPF0754 family)
MLKLFSLQASVTTMQWIQYILPVLVSCLTGWFVIWLAIKILFRPRRPIAIGSLKVQGILPGNQQAIAEQLGKMVSREFLSFDEIKKKVTDPANLDKLRPEIEAHIDSFLREKLKETFPMLSMFIGDKTINQLKAAFLMELESLFPALMTSYMQKLEQDIDLEKLVTQKVAGFSMIKAEELLNRSAKKLFLYLQLMGLLIGFVAGLLQVFVNVMIYS